MPSRFLSSYLYFIKLQMKGWALLRDEILIYIFSISIFISFLYIIIDKKLEIIQARKPRIYIILYN